MKPKKRGYHAFAFSGKGVEKLFDNEVGTHTWQRVPPTEKRGRMQTSSITVAFLEKDEYQQTDIQPNEVRIETTRGTGSGGQHKNTTDSCVVMTHLATGIKVVVDGRDQHKNKRDAFKEMSIRVNQFYLTGHNEESVDLRRDQIGVTGGRGDKRRTYRVKDATVVDHITGKTARLKDVLRGKIELLK